MDALRAVPTWNWKSPDMDVVDLPLERLIPYARNPRKNDSAIATVAASLTEFGWRQLIAVDEDMVILAGHTRIEAAGSSS